VLRNAWTCALVGLLSTAGFAGVARAENPHLSQARAKKLSLEYESALELLQRARETGENDRETLAEIYRLRGEIEAGLGRGEAATESFQYLLALQPEFSFPAGTSPKVLEPYHLARAFLNQRGPLGVRFEPMPGERPAVRVTVGTDPLSMVAGAAAHYRLPDGTRGAARALGTSAMRLELPPAEEIAVIAWVFDEHGNRLVSVGTDAAPLWVRTPTSNGAEPPVIRDGPRKPQPLHARWYTWAGGAVLAGAVGTYFGLEKLAADRDIEDYNDDSENHDFSETGPIEDRGRRAALFANISFAVAGSAAIVAGILLIRGDSRDRRAPKRAAIAPLITPDAAGLSFATAF
jgi:hypothetical protein